MHSEGDPNCQCMDCYGRPYVEEIDSIELPSYGD